jgi:hypothetical protein
MDEKDLKAFQLQIGEGIDVEITNSKGESSTFRLEPLESKHFGRFMFVIDNLPKKTDGMSDEEFIALFKTKMSVFEEVAELIKIMVRQTYPDLDAKMLERFTSKNFVTLMNCLFELNSDQGSDAQTKKKLEEFVKSKQNGVNGINKA